MDEQALIREIEFEIDRISSRHAQHVRFIVEARLKPDHRRRRIGIEHHRLTRMPIGELRARYFQRVGGIEIDGGIDGSIAVRKDDGVIARAAVDGIIVADVEIIIAVRTEEVLRLTAVESVHNDVDAAFDGVNEGWIGRAEVEYAVDGIVRRLNDEIQTPVLKFIDEPVAVIGDDVMHHAPRGASIEQVLQQGIQPQVFDDGAVPAEDICFVRRECLHSQPRARIPECVCDGRQQRRQDTERCTEGIIAVFESIGDLRSDCADHLITERLRQVDIEQRVEIINQNTERVINGRIGIQLSGQAFDTDIQIFSECFSVDRDGTVIEGHVLIEERLYVRGEYPAVVFLIVDGEEIEFGKLFGGTRPNGSAGVVANNFGAVGVDDVSDWIIAVGIGELNGIIGLNAEDAVDDAIAAIFAFERDEADGRRGAD